MTEAGEWKGVYGDNAQAFSPHSLERQEPAFHLMKSMSLFSPFNSLYMVLVTVGTSDTK